MKAPPLILGLIVAIATVLGVGWVLTRDTALQWAVHEAEARWPGKLSIEHARGSLLSKITADRIAWRDASLQVSAERVDFNWSLWWLSTGTIAFNHARAGAVTVATTDHVLPESLELPLRLRFDDLVDRLTLVGRDVVERPYAHVEFSLAAGPSQWKGKLAALPTEWGTWRGNGTVGTANPFPLEARHIVPDAPAATLDGTLHVAKDAQGVLRGTLSIDNRAAGTLDQNRLPVTAVKSAVVAGPEQVDCEPLILDVTRFIRATNMASAQGGATTSHDR